MWTKSYLIIIYLFLQYRKYLLQDHSVQRFPLNCNFLNVGNQMIYALSKGMEQF